MSWGSVILSPEMARCCSCWVPSSSASMPAIVCCTRMAAVWWWFGRSLAASDREGPLKQRENWDWTWFNHHGEKKDLTHKQWEYVGDWWYVNWFMSWQIYASRFPTGGPFLYQINDMTCFDLTMGGSLLFWSFIQRSSVEVVYFRSGCWFSSW